ncbi:unnamed protein product [Pylaiella littoralis]
MAQHQEKKKGAAAECLPPVAGDANLTSCPNCYLYFNYGNNDLVPKLISCGHLVCSTCVGDLFCDGSLCCPTCCEIHNCDSPSAFPAVPASPIPSPREYIPSSSDGVGGLMPPPVSVSPRPATSPSLTASPSPASTGNPQALFEEGSGGGASENRLANFLRVVNVPGGEEGVATDSMLESDEEGEGGGLCCLVTDCGRERMSSDYFCSRHMDKGKRVSWKAAKRMVQTMGKGMYSMSTVVQGEKLGQFLDTEMPSMDNLKPEILAERFQRQETITLGEALFLIDQALEILKMEPNALELKAPIKIVGDLHGQFFDLVSMLENCGAPRDGSSYLFLGDYVDRGEFSCEVLLYLLALKVQHPMNVHLIRGNHECRSLTTHFGFKDECKSKYGLPVYYRFLRCFELMPLCAVVANDHGRYFCTHGGISPGLESLDQIAALNRRAEPEMEGLLCDLLWADPSDDPGVTNIESLSDQEVDSLLSSSFQFNRLRGCSVAFGYLAVRKFLDNNDLMCVIRAHAVQEDGYYRHFEKALKRRDVDGHKKLPPVITVFSAPNYCDRYGNRAAVLGLLCEEIEPQVEHFECVDHPDRLNRPDRSEVHLTALIESCPYMPTTFRDFVKLAGRMGPAQPLADGGEASESSSVVGMGGDNGSSEQDISAKGSAPSSPPQARKDRSLTAHDLYELEAAHDRINELHPDYLNARIESCEDEGVSMLSTNMNKANTPSSVSSLVHSTTKITVSELRNRFDPAARTGEHSAPLPKDMGKPSSTVSQITSIFEHKARSERRKMHVRDGSGSGGIVSQMKASIESKAKAAATSPSRPGAPNSTKQKINVFEALTKRTRNDNVASKLTRVKDSALARRIWVDKVAGSPPPLWGGKAPPGRTFGCDKKGGKGGQGPQAGRGGSSLGGGRFGSVKKMTASPRRHSSSDSANGKFPPPPPPGAVAQADIGGGTKPPAPWRSNPPLDIDDALDQGRRRSTLGGETDSEMDDMVDRTGLQFQGETTGDSARVDSRSTSALAPESDAAALLASVAQLSSGEVAMDDADADGDGDGDGDVIHSPPGVGRRGTLADDCAFTHAEILGLKLLFALMDQRGSEFIDGVALEEYADEQDDYAQEREIEACIKAVDVDCDGKIGLMDFICFAARLKCYYERDVGLQKTLNHAGSKKRSSGMCMPGESDSDDDDDDDEDNEEEEEEEEEEGGADGGSEDVNYDRDDGDGHGDGGGGGDGGGNLDEGPAKEKQSNQRMNEEGDGEDAVGFDGGESNAGWVGTAAGPVACDPERTAPPGAGEARIGAVLVQKDSVVSASCAPSHTTLLASSASAGPPAEVPSQKPPVSALDVISVSSVQAALHAAVKSMSGEISGEDVQESEPPYHGAPTE